MDTPIQPKRKNKRLLLGGVAVAILLVTAIAAVYGRKSNSIDGSAVRAIAVERGDVGFDVSAYGTLMSTDQKVVASPAVALVEELVAQPGLLVEKGKPLLRLSSRELKEEERLARSLLSTARSDLRDERLAMSISDIEEAGKLEEMERQVILDRAELDAYMSLADTGIVSKLEMGRVEAKLAVSQSRLNAQRDRRRILADVGRSRVEAKEELLNETQRRLDDASNAVASLTVLAPDDVVVQDIDIALGQSVQAGERLMLIASGRSLLARLNVPQARASNIEVGAKVFIELQGRKYPGEVVRVDPSVRDGAVQVDVVPGGSFPDWAKDGQSVTATITAAGESAATFIRQVPEAAPFSQRDVFVIDEDTLRKRQVRFGSTAGDYIEIIAGARAGEEIASGVPSSLYRYDTLSKVN